MLKYDSGRTQIFNLPTRAFSFPTRAFYLVTRAFILLTRETQLVTRVLLFQISTIPARKTAITPRTLATKSISYSLF